MRCLTRADYLIDIFHFVVGMSYFRGGRRGFGRGVDNNNREGE
jgi:hypothetical protein